jgi:diacylglycerol O-acyltransferase
MWFLTGLDDGHVAVFVRVHHAIADGVTGVATLVSFLDLRPDAQTARIAWEPRKEPTKRELLVDNIRTRTRVLMTFLHALFNPSIVVRLLREALPSAREAFGERAPATSVNVTAGRDRTTSIVRGSLASYKEVAHVHGGTVNDVLLAAVSGGYRALLMSRGDDVDGVALRCFVPVSLPRSDGVGNRDAAMVVPLPIGEADPSRCLDAIVAETRERKKKPRVSGSVLFPTIFLQRLFLHFEANQHIMNAYVANVPGPADDLYLAGARIVDLFPLVPLLGNVTIGVGAMSYAGRFNVAIVSDPKAVPDIDVFARGFRDSIDVLTSERTRLSA